MVNFKKGVAAGKLVHVKVNPFNIPRNQFSLSLFCVWIIFMSFGLKCVPTQWKSLLKCNLAHSGLPSKKPPWENLTSNGSTATYWLSRSWKQNPIKIFAETFYLCSVSFPRRQIKYWLDRFEMGKVLPRIVLHRMHFQILVRFFLLLVESVWNLKSVAANCVASNAFSSKEPCDSRLWAAWSASKNPN